MNPVNLFLSTDSKQVTENLVTGVYHSDAATEYFEKLERQKRRKTISGEMDLLMRYLSMHEPEMLRVAERVRRQYKHASISMRNHLRKTIGETHWRRYLDFYCHFSRTKRRVKIELTNAHTASPPPFPTISSLLNEDVTAKIFSFLDGKALYEASKVSRVYRDALVPRQRNVTMEGFKSLASFRQMNFMGMVYFNGYKSNFQLDEFLQSVSLDRQSYPNLQRVNVALERNCSSLGLKLCEQNLGPRFESPFYDRKDS